MMGTPIPIKMRREMAEMPYYRLCALRSEHDCEGRITWEHAMTHGSKKVQEIWAIIPLCEWSHLGPGLNKEKNQWIALSRATDEDIEKYPRTDWIQKRRYLVDKYGEYGTKAVDKVGITCGQRVDKSAISPRVSRETSAIPSLYTGYAQAIHRLSPERTTEKVVSIRHISVTILPTKKRTKYI